MTMTHLEDGVRKSDGYLTGILQGDSRDSGKAAILKKVMVRNFPEC